ncbi:hypothetical protein [Staphylococcus aureus]|uniref:hypothetical protein n=1 Tax=Staphylococcus aureus TaxID=1280 RepID=UPI001FD4805F|nr:hypothetical protein [Staphylococcus aureus]MCJ8005702.1 hypothetical protein [Staphylococcus aureus]MCJ8032911.1 hypothetical protein [Staphylococcus aureus]
MRILLIAAVLVLGACQSASPKPNPPAPAIIKVPVATYVPIDAALTKRCNWVRAGKPSAVFEVSNGRKRCLDQYEAQFDAIEQVEGKPVPGEMP